MAEATWSYPTRILFGIGAVADVGKEAKNLGITKALVVADPGVAKAGLTAPVEKSLTAAGIEVAHFDAISTNPTEAEAKAAAKAYVDAKANGVIAVGGGAPLDVGKVVRVLVTESLPLVELDDAIGGDAKMKGVFPPMIAIPTTAGTGSEVGRSGVVTVEKTGKKTIIFHPKLVANVAVLDPKLTESLPPHITAATGFDALTHCIEAYLSKGDHPMADAIALKGIQLAGKFLERAVKNPQDLEARGAMLKSSMMGAVAFQKGLGVCHSLAHPLGAEHNMHHGLANAICLPAVLDFNRSAVQGRVAEVARALGVRGGDEDTLAFECSGAVRALRHKVGLPEGLRAQGITDADIPKLAKLALEDACHGANPRACTEQDMEQLYRVSL
ncbi:MAG TPA: iron-containing alcohol dehydrogenase [Polyangiales bacterium]|nr:iron-containing alcohol dehydrogenase [Polyangiales bacterium]